MKALLIATTLLCASVVLRAQDIIVPGERGLVTLPGVVHPLARPEFDRGAAPANLPMEHIVLMLARTPQQQKELDDLVEAQQNPSSPDFHHWLTPDEFGQRFGASPANIAKVTDWLQSQGFRIDEVPAGHSFIIFSGVVSTVRSALHTDIHAFVVNGKQHWANTVDPAVPADIASVVSGIVSLHNFESHPNVRVAGLTHFTKSPKGVPQTNLGDGENALSPADYAVIYNSNPLLNAGINGSGRTIAVLGRSNINLQDIADFRSLFGLPGNLPNVIVNGTNPGDLGRDEEVEAVLDNSWSGAVAPGATINFIVSASTNSTDGVFLSEQYAISHSSGDVITESFGTCEAGYTASGANSLSSLAQQAASEGMSYMVSTGDSGAAGCDSPSEGSETQGLSINVLASTPYTTGVGGTMFNEGGSSAFWSSSNGTNYVSAQSYIPENVWNESSAGSDLDAGGGGTSIYFAKPKWQTGVTGLPFDGWRDLPDVSLTAAAGHDPYMICVEGSCEEGEVYLVGGTSAAAPSFAGILALVDQKNGGRQGNANPFLYSLAFKQNYSACNGSNVSSLPASNCIFNDITVGNNAVPGESEYGTTSGLYQAGVGYDRATGLGSVNITNLADDWSGGSSSGPTVYYGIIGEQSGKAIQVSNASTASGAALVLWAWSQAADQEWQLVSPQGGYYEIINRNSGLAITDTGNSTAKATQMTQSPATGAADQLWQLIPTSNGYYRIVSKESGYVLNVYSAGTANGLAIIQWPWNNASNEQWQFVIGH